MVRKTIALAAGLALVGLGSFGAYKIMEDIFHRPEGN